MPTAQVHIKHVDIEYCTLHPLQMYTQHQYIQWWYAHSVYCVRVAQVHTLIPLAHSTITYIAWIYIQCIIAQHTTCVHVAYAYVHLKSTLIAHFPMIYVWVAYISLFKNTTFLYNCNLQYLAATNSPACIEHVHQARYLDIFIVIAFIYSHNLQDLIIVNKNEADQLLFLRQFKQAIHNLLYFSNTLSLQLISAAYSVHYQPMTAAYSIHHQSITAAYSIHHQLITAAYIIHCQPITGAYSIHYQPIPEADSIHYQPITAAYSFHYQPAYHSSLQHSLLAYHGILHH